MSIVLDTSFLLALNNRHDINHAISQSIKKRIQEGEFGQMYISDYIFDEFMTLLMARAISSEKIITIGNTLLSDQKIRILEVNMEVFFQSWEQFKKFGKLSFTDCTSIILSKEFSINNIASFDSDFDKIKEIKRIC